MLGFASSCLVSLVSWSAGLQYFQRLSLCTFPSGTVWILSFCMFPVWLTAQLPFSLRVYTDGSSVFTGFLQIPHQKWKRRITCSKWETKWHTQNSSKGKESSSYTLQQTSAMFTSHFTIPGADHVLGRVSADYIIKEWLWPQNRIRIRFLNPKSP